LLFKIKALTWLFSTRETGASDIPPSGCPDVLGSKAPTQTINQSQSSTIRKWQTSHGLILLNTEKNTENEKKYWGFSPEILA